MILRKMMPSVTDLKNQRGFSKIGLLAEKKPYLFVMRRKNVALGFSIGLAWGVIPLPIQVFCSIFTCYLFKANIPAAIFASFLTNPLTAPFILAFAYFLGSFFITQKQITSVIPSVDLLLSSPLTFLKQSITFFNEMGSTFIIGLPITAILFGIIGYYIVNFSWVYSVKNQRQKRLSERTSNFK